LRHIFFGPLPNHLKGVKETSPVMTVPLLVFTILAVIIGIYPKLVTGYRLLVIAGRPPPVEERASPSLHH